MIFFWRDFRFIAIGLLLAMPVILLAEVHEWSKTEFTLSVLPITFLVLGLVEWDERRTGIRAAIRAQRRERETPGNLA